MMSTPPARSRTSAAAWVVVCLPLAACVGGIDDPQRFGDGSYCPPDVDVETLFRDRCGGAICHGAGTDAAGGLDLESPGLAERMVGVPAEECEGRVRIVPGDPAASFLVEKLEGPPPGCGERMPFVGHLSANEVTCVRRWILEVGAAGGGSHDAGAQAADATDSTGGAP